MGYLKDLAIEIAAPLAANQYKWYTYSADRGTKFTTTNGKRSVSLKKGAKFGLRAASSGDKVRMITDELGPTIVFTLTAAQDEKLVAKAKFTKANPVKAAPADKKSTTADKTTSGDLSSTAKDLLKKNFTDLQPREANIQSLRKLGKLLMKVDRDPLTNRNITSISALKTTKAAFKISPKGPATAVQQAITLGRKYIAQGIKSLEGIYFSDAADMFALAEALNRNSPSVSKMSFDTNIREDMPKGLYTLYSKLYYKY